MESLRVGVVGVGAAAQAYLDVIEAGGVEIDVAALVDHDPRAMGIARRLGVPLHRSVHELLDAAPGLGIDAVLVCTPPISHVPTATAVLEAGLAVHCEKPLALNRPGIHMMFDAADRAGKLVMTAAKYRYVADVVRAKELIDGGDLGDVVLYRNVFTSSTDMRGKWNARKELAGGGVIIDLGSHAVDLARYLLGPVRSVVTNDVRHLQGLDVEDTAQVMFRNDIGVGGTVELSWSAATEFPWFVNIDGTRGAIRIGWDRSEINQGMGWVRFGDGYSRNAAFRAQLNDFADAVRYDKTPQTTTADAAASVAVIDAAYRSLQTGSWVRVVDDRRSTGDAARALARS